MYLKNICANAQVEVDFCKLHVTFFCVLRNKHLTGILYTASNSPRYYLDNVELEDSPRYYPDNDDPMDEDANVSQENLYNI